MLKQYTTYNKLLKNAMTHKIVSGDEELDGQPKIDQVELDILEANYLRLHGIQEFIRNYAGPNTDNNRIVMMWDTGVGKTLGAISVAMEFIKYLRAENEKLYKAGEDQSHVGSVFILGFTSNVFKRELMKHPDFGFISREEIAQKQRLTKIAELGTQEDQERLMEFNNMIKKRLTSRRRNGFFKFIGYRELVNHLFIPTKSQDIQAMDESQIISSLADGSLKINEVLLAQFNNSMIICDEIHNVYNSSMKNNWGVAIQVVLDKYPKLRAIFLSATPFNNSPTEIINLLNLLIPSKLDGVASAKLDKSDYFNGEELKPGALEKLSKLCEGKFSYIRDTDTRYMPKRVIVGEQIEGIPYLRFIRCPMSPFHYFTYKTVFTGALNQDERYLTEFALPNPANNSKETKITKADLSRLEKITLEPGLYKTEDVKYTIPDAPEEWKTKMGISANGESVDGSILHLSKIGTYSTKYKMMIREIVRLIRLGRGKILLFHPSVQVSGVTTIANALVVNGLLDESSPPGDDTICSYCGYSRKLHGKKSLPVEIISELIEDELLGNSSVKGGDSILEKSGGGPDVKHKKVSGKSIHARLIARFFEPHEYQPARFILAHAKVDKNQLFYMRDKFNNESNLDGGRYKIMLGARMIKEAIDFTAVRNILIVARVDNISSLIQVIGRAVRRKSHIRLPAHQRSVYVKIFVSSDPVNPDKLTYEEEKYKDKMGLYLTIQKIEKMIHEGAIDRCINAAPEQKMETLGPLPYKVKCPTISCSSVNWDSFNAYHGEEEVGLIVTLIKRFFLQNPVWHTDDLWHAVTHPPHTWDVAPNPELFDKNNFLVACYKLTHGIFVQVNYLESLFNSSTRTIVDREGHIYGIHQLRDLLILCPFVDGKLVIDVEQPFRVADQDVGGVGFIDISSYLETKSIGDEYPFKKLKFKQKFEKVDIDDMDYAICEFGSEFHSLLLCDCIAYVFDSWTGKAKKSEYHDFYFKMLTFYDIIGVVIWADSAKEFVLEHYTQLIGKRAVMATDSDIVRMLKSSINTWVPNEAKKKMAAIMTMSNAIHDSNPKHSTKLKSSLVPPSALPIGNAINKVPKFYHYEPGQAWTEVSNYIDHSVSQWVENDVLVGYDEKSKSGVHIRFKIRNPIQNVKLYKDTRKIERGTVCSSKGKEFLLATLKKINGQIPSKLNVGNLCSTIRKALIAREIAERKKGTNIKWFYHYFDQTRPDLSETS